MAGALERGWRRCCKLTLCSASPGTGCRQDGALLVACTVAVLAQMTASPSKTDKENESLPAFCVPHRYTLVVWQLVKIHIPLVCVLVTLRSS